MSWRIHTTVAITLFVGACKDQPPRAGEPCSAVELPSRPRDVSLGPAGGHVCSTASEALRCVGGWWEATPCRGPKGCVAGDSGLCDKSQGQSGDPCDETGFGQVCDVDRRVLLACVDGRLAVERECQGPHACEAGICDQQVSEVGKPCRTSDVAACSADKKTLLKCEASSQTDGLVGAANGRFVVAYECPSEIGCRHQSVARSTSVPVCDWTGVAEGTACGKGNETAVICHPNGKALMRCGKDSKFERFRDCEPGQTCQPDRGTCL